MTSDEKKGAGGAIIIFPHSHDSHLTVNNTKKYIQARVSVNRVSGEEDTEVCTRCVVCG